MNLERLKWRLRNYRQYAVDILHASRSEAKKAGWSRARAFADILWERLRYGTIVQDYHLFGFSYLKDNAVRRTFLNGHDWQKMDRAVNNTGRGLYNYESKIRNYKLFKDFFKREFFILNERSLEDLQAFMDRFAFFFAKEDMGFGGIGVEKVKSADFRDAAELLRYLRKKKYDLLEEPIQQNAVFEAIAPGSLNTVRITTLVNEQGEVYMFPLHVVRMSDGTSPVDNLTSGGMFVLVDGDGVVVSEYASAENHAYDMRGDLKYSKHPMTGISFKGYRFPLIPEAEAMVREMLKYPDMSRYLGFDIGFTETEPVLVEINPGPGYDMHQNYHQLGSRKVGNKALYEEKLGVRIDSLK